MYLRVFGRLPRFGARENLWSFPAAVLERPMLRADADLSRFFEGYVEQLDARVASRSLADGVRAAIADRLCDGELTLSAVARGLKQSARTLQRRLADEGTSLSALVEAVRRERACAHHCLRRAVGRHRRVRHASRHRAGG